MKQRTHTLIYSQNKILCFVGPEGVKEQECLPLLVHHFQYTCLYYEKIYNHFKDRLKSTQNNIRLQYGEQMLPCNKPIGLYIPLDHSGQCHLTIREVEQPCEQPFSILMKSWKQGYNILNPSRGVEFLMKRMKKEEILATFDRYCKGQSINLPDEHEIIAIRGFYKGQIIERKHNLQGKVLDLIKQLWPGLFGSDGNIQLQYQKSAKFRTHGVLLNLDNSIQNFFNFFSYNDGFWYVSLELD